MAAGDIVVFMQAKVDLGNKVWNLETDVVKLALITNAVTPTETDPAPHWQGTGTTNFNTNEVTPGGNYTAEGMTVANNVFIAASPNAKFDGDDITIAQHASNPTNARWGILYNDTDASKRCIGYLDLGGVKDLTTGAFTVTWAGAGIFTLS